MSLTTSHRLLKITFRGILGIMAQNMLKTNKQVKCSATLYLKSLNSMNYLYRLQWNFHSSLMVLGEREN